MREELNVLYKVDHPYIINHIQSFEDEKYLYFVMEYCNGADLYKLLEEKGTLTE